MPSLTQSIVATDLMTPPLGTGEISPSFFPTENPTTLLARVTRYLSAGYARAENVNGNQGTDLAKAQADYDLLARSWAYYLAYADVWRDSIVTPSKILTASTTVQQDKDQRDSIRELMDAHFASAMRLFEQYQLVQDTLLTERHGTVTVPTVYSW